MATTFDIDHAAFVRLEYRSVSVTSTDVKSQNTTGSREVNIDTNLDGPNALQIANNILADNAKPRAFEIELEGTLGANALIGGPPAYQINSVKWQLSNYSVKSFSISDDYDKNTTVVQVRG
jgi:hypothetical protein